MVAPQPRSLKDVLAPPGPIIEMVVLPEPPSELEVMRDPFGFFGFATVIATAIKTITRRNRHRLRRWIRLTAVVMAGYVLADFLIPLLRIALRPS